MRLPSFLLLLLSACCLSFTHALHEEDAGKFDWHKTLLGPVTHARFEVRKGGREEGREEGRKGGREEARWTRNVVCYAYQSRHVIAGLDLG